MQSLSQNTSVHHMSLVVSGVNGDKAQTSLYDEAVVLSGHTGAVYSVQFSPEGNHIASAGLDRSIRLWNLPTSAEDATPNYGVVEGHKGGITSLKWASQTKMVSTSADSTVSVWDAETGQRTKTGKGHELTVNDCSTSVEGVYISVGDDGTLRVWDEREKHEVRKIETEYPILACDISSDGKTAFFSGIDPTIRAFDLSTGTEIWNCDQFSESASGLALSGDQSMLVSRAMNGSVYTVNAKPKVPQNISRRGQTYDGAVGGAQMLLSRARFSKDDVYIASASDDQSVTIWSTSSRRIVSRATGHEAAVVDVDFHPYEKLIASCSIDGSIIVREY